MVGFLKNLIGSYLFSLKLPEFFCIQWSNINVHPPDFPMFGFNFINSPYGVQYIGKSILGVAFSGDKQDSLVPLANEVFDLLGNFLLGQGAPHNPFVGRPEGTIKAFIRTQIGNV